MELTTLLDLLGLLLIVLAVAIWIGAWLVPCGIAAGGVGLLAVSWLIDLPGRRRGK